MHEIHKGTSVKSSAVRDQIRRASDSTSSIRIHPVEMPNNTKQTGDFVVVIGTPNSALAWYPTAMSVGERIL